MENKIEYIIFGILFSCVSYFLKDVIDDVKELKRQIGTNKTELDVLKNDFINKYENLTSRFDELKEYLSEIVDELKELRKEIRNK